MQHLLSTDINSLFFINKKKKIIIIKKKSPSLTRFENEVHSLLGQPLTNYYNPCGLSIATAFSLISTNFDARGLLQQKPHLVLTAILCDSSRNPPLVSRHIL
jgi:hypothetical protein